MYYDCSNKETSVGILRPGSESNPRLPDICRSISRFYTLKEEIE
jgi:hypothetical protein